MRNLFILIACGLLFAACSSKVAEISMVNQAPCKSERTLGDKEVFYGETVDNLTLTDQGGSVSAVMNVIGRCNAKYNFKIDKQGNTVKIKVIDTVTENPKCLCTMTVETKVSNLPSGSYSFMVTDEAGKKLLAQQNITVK